MSKILCKKTSHYNVGTFTSLSKKKNSNSENSILQPVTATNDSCINNGNYL